MLLMSKTQPLPLNWIRFLPGEVVLRWPIRPDQLPSFDGTPAQLIALLRETLDVSDRRASDEVDQFVRDLDEKIQRAILTEKLGHGHATAA